MQIDELPAGEQTQHPDLDMNQVVGTHDILMLCFDTLRYDVSKGGRRGRKNAGTEQSRRRMGKKDMRREISLTRLILPSLPDFCLLRRNLIRYVAVSGCFSPCKLVQDVFRLREVIRLQEATFVQSLANVGYETICIGGVNFFSKRNELGRVFPGYFTKSYWLPTFGCTAPDSTEKQIDFALKKLENYPEDKRILCISIFLLFIIRTVIMWKAR